MSLDCFLLNSLVPPKWTHCLHTVVKRPTSPFQKRPPGKFKFFPKMTVWVTDCSRPFRSEYRNECLKTVISTFNSILSVNFVGFHSLVELISNFIEMIFYDSFDVSKRLEINSVLAVLIWFRKRQVDHRIQHIWLYFVSKFEIISTIHWIYIEFHSFSPWRTHFLSTGRWENQRFKPFRFEYQNEIFTTKISTLNSTKHVSFI